MAEETALTFIFVSILSIAAHSFGLFAVVKESYILIVSYTVILIISTVLSLIIYSNLIVLLCEIVFDLMIVSYTCFINYKHDSDVMEASHEIETL